jgi:hypothetical protein
MSGSGGGGGYEYQIEDTQLQKEIAMLWEKW